MQKNVLVCDKKFFFVVNNKGRITKSLQVSVDHMNNTIITLR